MVTAAALATTMTGMASASPHTTRFLQVNQVSDQPGVAPLTDPDLVNAWGLAASATSPLWVADNGSNLATLYTGTSSLSKLGLVVSVTGGAPTGQVHNDSGSGFTVSNSSGQSGSSVFLFDSEDGTIEGWNPAVSAATEIAVNNGANAVYKGLAMATASDGNTYLYATNFRSGRVEVYDSTFTPAQLPGGLFADPGMPAGFAPFGIAEIGGQLYVTYAQQDAALHDSVAGQGAGFVDVFTNDGAFVRRLVTRGALNSPWGLALAPASFGSFGGDLLIGNFGDGHINAYNPTTGAHVGELRQADGRPIVIDGLWGLRVGNGTFAGTGEVAFSAGPDGETHGLLGKIVPLQ
jgi:uncharacterized protein (TIGR03118 family)